MSFVVDVLYRCGGKLIGKQTRRPLTVMVTEFLFAGNI